MKERQNRDYRQNARWLSWFAPFRTLSISAAYLTPFFLEKGLSLSQIFALQSIFSAAVLLWELPSGRLADKYGRVFCIKLSVPFAALAMVAYGLSDSFWQFAVCELVLAVASGLYSGVDTALLIDSLKAAGQERQYVKISQRMNAFGYASIAVGVPVAVVLVHYVGISSTLIADGLLTLVGVCFVWRLVEAPRSKRKRKEPQSAKRALHELLRKPEVRWLLVLGTALSTATYLGFWLSALYYQKLGVPVVLFSVLLAVRSLWKAWLSHRFHIQHRLQRAMSAYALLVLLVFLAMASGQIWLIWIVLGHDAIQALHAQPLSHRLNAHMDADHRAMLNSVTNVVQRLAFTVAGPLVGLTVDQASLTTGLVATGCVFSAVAFVALARLRQLNTFREE
jgi:MFS family permease